MRKKHFQIKEHMKLVDEKTLMAMPDPDNKQRARLTYTKESIRNYTTMCDYMGLDKNNCEKVCAYLKERYIFRRVQQFKEKVMPNATPETKVRARGQSLNLDKIVEMAKNALEKSSPCGLSKPGGDENVNSAYLDWHAAHFVIQIVVIARRLGEKWAIKKDTREACEGAARLIGWYYYLYTSKDDPKAHGAPNIDPKGRRRSFSGRLWLRWFEQEKKRNEQEKKRKSDSRYA